MRVTNELRLLAMIDAGERAGSPGPSNEQICETIGFSTHKSATRLVIKAVDDGAISTAYPDGCTRTMALTDAGRRQLLAVGRDILANRAPARRGPDTTMRSGRPVDISRLPPIADDGPARAARSAAINANARFLAAMARLAPVPDAIDRDGGRFNRLPPPALTGQSFS